MMKILKKIGFAVVMWIYIIIVNGTILFLKLIPLHRVMKRKRKLLYLASYFPENAGYHYRIAKWRQKFKTVGITVKILRVVKNKDHFRDLIQRKYYNLLLLSLWKRYWQIMRSMFYDQVIVRRTILLYNEYGNMSYERLLLTIHPNAILDFDDDLTLQDDDSGSSAYGRFLLERKDKFTRSLLLYRRFICGATNLKQMVIDVNQGRKVDVVTIPTCVDYPKYAQKSYDKLPDEIYIGWIGSDGNQHYLNRVIEGLNKLHEKHPIRLLVISGKAFKCKTNNFPLVNLSWSLYTEINTLQKLDIGLMPLEDSKMERGKCGFKLIQYMGLGIVSYASAVGANKDIINHGVNGFLVQNDNEWDEIFSNVPEQWSKFKEISKSATTQIVNNYSFDAHFSDYKNFLGY